MSDFILNDGTGTGKKAKVLSDNSLKTFSISEDLLQEQLRQGKSYYVSAGAVDFLGGSTGTTEYVFFEFYNSTAGSVLIQSPEVWLSPAHTIGPYAETTDQYCRFNQWISDTAYLDTSGNDSINENLNGLSTFEIPNRANGNSAVRNADQGDTVAVPPKTSAAGYICGFLTSHIHGKASMLPDGQGIVLGKGQSWIVSCKPVQNSAPTNHIMGCRASIIDISGVGV